MKQITSLILVLFLSINAFGQWEECNVSGIYGTGFFRTHDFVEHTGVLYNATDHGVLKSENGDDWNLVSNDVFNRFETTGSILLGGKTNNMGIYKSIDEGSTWELIGLEDKKIYSISYDDNTIYVGTDNNIYISEDNGNTWIEKNNSISNEICYIKKIRENEFIAAVISGLDFIIIKSDDNMNTWYTATINNKQDNTHNKTIFGYYYKIIVTNNIVTVTANEYLCYRSTDFGDSFSSFHIGGGSLRDIELYNEDFYCISHVYIPSTDETISISSNNCLTWNSFSATYIFEQMIIKDDEIFASTQTAIYKQSINNLTADIKNAPDNNSKIKVYPNPCKTKLNVSFKQQTEILTISIYDIQGNEVDVLSNNELIKGKQTVDCDISNYAPGIYLIKFQFNNQVISKRLIIK